MVRCMTIEEKGERVPSDTRSIPEKQLWSIYCAQNIKLILQSLEITSKVKLFMFSHTWFGIVSVIYIT